MCGHDRRLEIEDRLYERIAYCKGALNAPLLSYSTYHVHVPTVELVAHVGEVCEFGVALGVALGAVRGLPCDELAHPL